MPGLDQTVVVEYDAEEAWPTLQSTPKLRVSRSKPPLFPFCNSCFSIQEKKRRGKGKRKKRKEKMKGK